MGKAIAIHLAKPIKSVKILTTEDSENTRAQEQKSTRAKEHKDTYDLCTRALQGVITKLNQFYDGIFAQNREQIAKLSVEIARKILIQKVQNGDYEIEAIVKEALNKAPTRQDVVVHLNPEDLVQCQKAGLTESAGSLAGIKFVPDPNIGKAECLLETPKGIIKLLIDEQLERVTCALKKVE